MDRIGDREEADSGAAVADQGSPAAAEAARYELIDYKTSRPKTVEQLRDDV